MKTRNSSAHWSGTLKEGSGTISMKSGVLKSIPYDFKSRFEEGTHTSPEELIAAAHAACFSMHLSGQLEKHGAEIKSIDTTATVTIEKEIVDSVLDTIVTAKGVDEETFNRLANFSKENCPVSRVLKCKISLTTQLIEAKESPSA